MELFFSSDIPPKISNKLEQNKRLWMKPELGWRLPPKRRLLNTVRQPKAVPARIRDMILNDGSFN
jgi:hypothetical protein